MSNDITRLFEIQGGEFVSPPSVFIEKLRNVRAVVFDWDGVFNDGFKQGQEGSSFSEVDAMGTNLLRYALWKQNGRLPVTAIITGEKNPSANAFASRENFNSLFFLAKNKGEVFDSFCSKYAVAPEDTLFFFDDVLDLPVARQGGARVMITRRSTLMLKNFVKKNALTDYLSANDGGGHGLRESCELVIGLLGLYDTVVQNRMTFSVDYEAYLTARRQVVTEITEISR